MRQNKLGCCGQCERKTPSAKSAMASSNELVCSDWVPPARRHGFKGSGRTTNCCKGPARVSDTPEFGNGLRSTFSSARILGRENKVNEIFDHIAPAAARIFAASMNNHSCDAEERTTKPPRKGVPTSSTPGLCLRDNIPCRRPAYRPARCASARRLPAMW